MKEKRVVEGRAKRRWTGPTAYLGGITWRCSFRHTLFTSWLPRSPYHSIFHTHSPSHSRTAEQIHFVFIKFHKASRQTTRLYFPFSRLGRHSAEGECHGKWRTRGGRWLHRATRPMSFLLPLLSHFLLSLSLSLFYPVIFLLTCTSVHAGLSSLFLSLPASQRELGVTIQSTCFTFKSSRRAAISNRASGMACIHVHCDCSRSTTFVRKSRKIRCWPVLLP